jgi:hypothetical protein
MNTIRTTGEFVNLVKAMRTYQKMYFEEENAYALKLAKKHEGLVDQAIAEREARTAAQQQPGLPGCKS